MNAASTGEKKLTGRKRFLLVDTSGNVLQAAVLPADVGEREGARWTLGLVHPRLPTLELIWADAGYEGASMAEWVLTRLRATLEIVKRSDNQSGFVVQPLRWIVERTFAWLGRFRRLSKDYEHLPETSEAIMYLASIRRFLTKLDAVS